MRVFGFAVSLAVVGWGCAEPAGSDASAANAAPIVGGVVERAGSELAQRTIFFGPASSGGAHGCTATLLDASHALTARHCLFGIEDVPDPALFFGPRAASSEPMRSVVSWRSFNDGFDDDIAVLTFAGGIPDGFVTVELAEDLVLVPGMVVVQAGFGAVDGDGSDRGVLRSVESTLRGVDSSTSRLLVSDVGHTTCNGDSGGPDFVRVDGRLVQIGVHVSGDCKSHSSSTDVRAYLAWIRRQLARQ